MGRLGLIGPVIAILEIPWLILLNLLNHFWSLWLWIGEIRRFYGNSRLLKADLLWMMEYGLRNPFSISRQATLQQGLPADLTVYGETPWTTLERICEMAGLSSDDVFVELGAGTGRNLLFIHYWYGARAIGYELIPRFVEKFTWLQHHLQLGGLAQMQAGNWFDADLEATGATVLLLVGTCYSDEHLKTAADRLSRLPSGSRILTVSYQLEGPAFEQIGEFQAAFSWGRGTVFYQKKI
ncbi:MAG: hypothetical protein CVV27_18705 [Candidatus Melainabacteria bacterium HGW-Melainabacteria-1]|nr:MAG: hypothetical protein CVV27_18705 [Candidatus Melainabacteria bacterium HGW-Melainabacteria-1]